MTKFVRDVNQAVADAHPVPVAMTCGRPEENLGNNRSMAAALARLGYEVQLREVADVHNYTAWRDAFDPWLGGLIQRVTGAAANAGPAAGADADPGTDADLGAEREEASL